MEWKNVTKHFTEEERQYNGKYLEIDEVYDDVVEVSLFSAKDDIYEIYISFGIEIIFRLAGSNEGFSYVVDKTPFKI